MKNLVRWSCESTLGMRMGLALLLGVGLALSLADGAHAAKNAGYTDSGGPQCVYNWSSTYRNWGAEMSWARGGVRSVRTASSYCPYIYSSWHRRPPGYLALKFYVFKSYGDRWYVCKRTRWRYNTEPSSRLGRRISIGWKYRMPCGRGYYGTTAYGYVYNEDRWQGGGMWSGWQYLK